ncbi:hypothetical protein V6N13_082470 [Hibiscus sabdariffa]
MLAENKKRKPRKNFQSDIGSDATDHINLGSRFEVLRKNGDDGSEGFQVETVSHGAGDVVVVKNLGQPVAGGLPISSSGSRKKGLVQGSGGTTIVALRQGAPSAVTNQSMTGTSGNHTVVLVREDLVSVGYYYSQVASQQAEWWRVAN